MAASNTGMYQSIINRVGTSYEARLLIVEIEMLLKSLYRTGDKDFNSTLDRRVRAWVAQEMRKGLAETEATPEDYLKGLKGHVEGLGKIVLTLAYHPTKTGTDNITKWVRNNVPIALLVDFHYDPSIVGGALFEYKGKYRDFTVRRKLSDYFNQLKLQ